MRMCAIAVLAAVLLGGCGGVVSKAPASDDATSRYDERLVGFWHADAVASGQGKPTPSQDEAILAFGRQEGADRIFELIGVELHPDKRLELSRGEFTATTIDAKDYASLGLPLTDKAEAKERSWGIVRYEMPDADTLIVVGMDEKAVAADVKAGTIAGATESRAGSAVTEPTLVVTLSASTTVLRAYLEQRGDGAFATARPLVLRRLHLR